MEIQLIETETIFRDSTMMLPDFPDLGGPEVVEHGDVDGSVAEPPAHPVFPQHGYYPEHAVVETPRFYVTQDDDNWYVTWGCLLGVSTNSSVFVIVHEPRVGGVTWSKLSTERVKTFAKSGTLRPYLKVTLKSEALDGTGQGGKVYEVELLLANGIGQSILHFNPGAQRGIIYYPLVSLDLDGNIIKRYAYDKWYQNPYMGVSGTLTNPDPGPGDWDEADFVNGLLMRVTTTGA